MFIIPAGKFSLSHYSSKKELIIPLKKSTYPLFRPTKWHYYIIPTKKISVIHTPLFLFTPQIRTSYVVFQNQNQQLFIFSFRNLLQVGDPNEDSVGEPPVTGPDHELVVDTTSPPEEIKERAVNLIKYMKGDDVKPEESVVSIELWDFAGQHLYYASHPLFLSSRALYILVCNLSKSLHDTAKPCVRQGSRNVDLENPNGETNLENLLSWLSTVHSVAQMRRETCDDVEEEVPHLRPPVIIVGTHADKPFEDIETMKTEIQNAIAGKDYEGHVVRPIFSIDNTAKLLPSKIRTVFRKDENIDDIRALQAKIMEVLRQEPYIGEEIPMR